MLSLGAGFWMIDFGTTKVIVPSTVALLEGSRLPLGVNTRAVLLGVLVTPHSKLGPPPAPIPFDAIAT